MESPETYYNRDSRACIVSVEDEIMNLDVHNETPLLGFCKLNILALTLGGYGLHSVFDMSFPTDNDIRQSARRVLFRILTGISNSETSFYLLSRLG